MFSSGLAQLSCDKYFCSLCVSLSVCVFVYMSLCLFICLCVCLYVSLFVYLSVCLFLHLFVCNLETVFNTFYSWVRWILYLFLLVGSVKLLFVCLSVHQCLTTFGPHLDQKTETNFCIETSLEERRKKLQPHYLFSLLPKKLLFPWLIIFCNKILLKLSQKV